MNTVITLPDGKRIIITPQANPRIVKMVNNVLHKMNDREITHGLHSISNGNVSKRGGRSQYAIRCTAGMANM